MNNYPKSYYSKKIPNKVAICRSPIEFKYFRQLDNDTGVLRYTPEPFKIAYEYDNKALNYVPDVLIEYANGIKKLAEIKVMSDVCKPINIAKFNAAKEYAHQHGMIFKIIVRHAEHSRLNLPIEGEYDDYISAMKSENRWILKRVATPGLILALFLLFIFINSGLKDTIFIIIAIIFLLIIYFSKRH